MGMCAIGDTIFSGIPLCFKNHHAWQDHRACAIDLREIIMEQDEQN